MVVGEEVAGEDVGVVGLGAPVDVVVVGAPEELDTGVPVVGLGVAGGVPWVDMGADVVAPGPGTEGDVAPVEMLEGVVLVPGVVAAVLGPEAEVPAVVVTGKVVEEVIPSELGEEVMVTVVGMVGG